MKDSKSAFAGKGYDKSEIYYRTMSQSDYDYLRMTGELPSTGKTCISPTKSYSSKYEGVMVRFELNFPFEVKCVRAIYYIGKEKAYPYLEKLYKHPNCVVREMAQRQIKN